MDKARYRNKVLTGDDGVGGNAICSFLVKAQVVSMGQESMIAGIVIPYFVQSRRYVCRVVLFFVSILFIKIWTSASCVDRK